LIENEISGFFSERLINIIVNSILVPRENLVTWKTSIYDG